MDINNQTIEIDSTNVRMVADNFISQVNGINFDNVTSSNFTSLTDFGIGTKYFNTLEENLKGIKKDAKELVNMLKIVIEQHEKIDQSDKKYNSYSASTNNSNRVERRDSKLESERINEKFKDSIVKLEFEKVKSLFVTLLDNKTNIQEILNLESKAKDLKEILLKDVNIPNDLKELMLKMEDKELQRTLLAYLKKVDIRSKHNTILNKEFGDNSKSVKLSSILNDYNNLINEGDISSNLLSVYDGNNKVNTETFNITKTLIEKLAIEKGITVEELLTKSENKDYLIKETEDFYDALIVNTLKEKVEV